jgi:LysM repeat protein
LVMSIRTVILSLLLLTPLLACNLTSAPPTPTPRPVTPSVPTQGTPPTLFPSITPLVGSGGGFVTQTPPPPSGCIVPVGWIPYQIQTGDSLGALADATSTTIQALVTANCLTDPDTLYTGQTIYLPRSPISG